MIEQLDPIAVRGRLDQVAETCAGRAEILVAIKYVPVEMLGLLAEAGVELVGENRLQDLEAKRARWGEIFRWDFIGALQSRKVKQLLPVCDRIHSVASESALRRLSAAIESDTHESSRLPEVLLQVNVAGESTKSGFLPEQLAEAIELSPVPIAGLMTMPPLAANPEDSRPYFAKLAELAAGHGLSQLSMGTSQDWQVAVEEGSTVIRLGASLLR